MGKTKFLLTYGYIVWLLWCLHVKLRHTIQKTRALQKLYRTNTTRIRHHNTNNNRKIPKIPTNKTTKTKPQKSIGAGHPFNLTLPDRLIMLLTYYRLYTSSTLLGYLFNINQSNVLKNIRILEPLIQETLPLPKHVHQKVKKIQTTQELETMFPGFTAF